MKLVWLDSTKFNCNRNYETYIGPAIEISKELYYLIMRVFCFDTNIFPSILSEKQFITKISNDKIGFIECYSDGGSVQLQLRMTEFQSEKIKGLLQ